MVVDCMNEKAFDKIKSCLFKEMKYIVQDDKFIIVMWRTLEEMYL